jgi:hypothetical protein
MLQIYALFFTYQHLFCYNNHEICHIHPCAMGFQAPKVPCRRGVAEVARCCQRCASDVPSKPFCAAETWSVGCNPIDFALQFKLFYCAISLILLCNLICFARQDGPDGSPNECEWQRDERCLVSKKQTRLFCSSLDFSYLCSGNRKRRKNNAAENTR